MLPFDGPGALGKNMMSTCKLYHNPVMVFVMVFVMAAGFPDGISCGVIGLFQIIKRYPAKQSPTAIDIIYSNLMR